MSARFLHLHACTVDVLRREALQPGGTAIRLSAQETELIIALAEAQGAPRSRDALLEAVHGASAGQPRRIDSAIARLRRKIEQDPRRPRSLVKVYGAGYRLLTLREERASARRASPPLVGRDATVARLEAWMADRPAAITVHGPPGVGKTAIAEALSTQRPLWHCDLDGCASPDEAVARIAAVLGVPVHGDDPEATLARVFAARGGCGLWLDHPEGITAAVADLVARIRQDAPRVTVLTTARSLLGVPDERALAVAPLQPDDAVALLLAHAPAERPAVAHEVARRLDHLPLGLVLAGALAGSVGLDAVAARLQYDPDLRNPVRDAPARHRSLSAAVAVGLDELGASASAALYGLVTLSRPFDAHDVRALLGAGGPSRVRRIAAIGLVTPAGGRQRVLRVVRELLRARADAEAWRRHRELHVALLGDLRARVYRSTSQAATDRFAELWTDLERAHGALVRAGEPERAAAVAVGVAECASTTSVHIRPALQLLERSLPSERTPGEVHAWRVQLLQLTPGPKRRVGDAIATVLEAPETAPAVTARVRFCAAHLAIDVGRYDDAVAHALASRALATDLGDTLLGAQAGALAGAQLIANGRPEGWPLVEASVAVLTAEGATALLPMCLVQAAHSELVRGDLERAGALAARAVALAMGRGDRANHARAAWLAAFIAGQRGDLDRALALTSMAAEAFSLVGQTTLADTARGAALGYRVQAGDWTAFAELQRHSVTVQRSGTPRQIAAVHLQLGACHHHRRELDEAVRCYRRAHALTADDTHPWLCALVEAHLAVALVSAGDLLGYRAAVSSCRGRVPVGTEGGPTPGDAGLAHGALALATACGPGADPHDRARAVAAALDLPAGVHPLARLVEAGS